MTQKEQEKNQLENTLKELQKDLLKGLEFNRLKSEKISDFLKIAMGYFVKYKDKNFLKNLFFLKVGNTTLFNKLGLRQYYLEQEVVIEYNAKKEKLWIAGNFEEIKESFLEYKERMRQEQKEQNERLTKKEKLEKTYRGRFSVLDKESKKILMDLLKV